MVVIEGGCFDMGSPDSETGHESEERHHRACIDDFAIGKHEVAVAAFRLFVDATGYETDVEREDGCRVASDDGDAWEFDSGRNWRNPGFPQRDADPVVCVSWNDAMAYVEWLNGETEKHYRLPREDEWEHAARAGSKASRIWGDNADHACTYANGADKSVEQHYSNWWSTEVSDCDDGFVNTAPVGTFRANAFSLHDMLGNVWEWTCSAYDEDYGGDESLCVGQPKGALRAVRGGGWYSRTVSLRSARRLGVASDASEDGLGFRLAQDP